MQCAYSVDMQNFAQADASMPNTNGWQDRHNTAMLNPQGAETPIVTMIGGWILYARRHLAQYQSTIGEDGVLGPEWEAIGDALRGLLNGELGRLDAGTLDHRILQVMRDNDVETENK